MFKCRGCKTENRDKDLGNVLKYTLPTNDDVSLFFCYSPKNQCWFPTAYYMLSNMSAQDRLSVGSVVLQEKGMFMDTVKSFSFSSLEDLYTKQLKMLESRKLSEINLLNPLDHYEKVGKELAGGDYKRSSDMIDVMAQMFAKKRFNQ